MPRVLFTIREPDSGFHPPRLFERKHTKLGIPYWVLPQSHGCVVCVTSLHLHPHTRDILAMIEERVAPVFRSPVDKSKQTLYLWSRPYLSQSYERYHPEEHLLWSIMEGEQ